MVEKDRYGGRAFIVHDKCELIMRDAPPGRLYEINISLGKR
jgi:hypothetical protein